MIGMIAFSRDLVLSLDETTVRSVPNPIGFLGEDVLEGPFETLWNAGLLSITFASVTAFAGRVRKASSVERQQFKCLLLAVALFGLVYAGLATTSGGVGGVLDLLFALSVGAIPVAVAIGVLRYRLYEIDRIISRTVGYLLVVALLGVVFLLPFDTRLGGPGGVTSGGRRIDLGGGRTVQPAAEASPGVGGPAVQPGPRYDAQKVMDEFALSLQDEIDGA